MGKSMKSPSCANSTTSGIHQHGKAERRQRAGAPSADVLPRGGPGRCDRFVLLQPGRHELDRLGRRGLARCLQGLRPDHAVRLDAEGLLQKQNRGQHAEVDRGIEHAQGERAGQLVALDRAPVVALVDLLGLLERQVRDVELGVRALGNPVAGGSARIVLVAGDGATALVRQDYG